MKEQRRKENHSLCGFYVRVYCEVQMNLFRLFYENPRAEIPEDAPPKTGAALLFEIVRRDGWDICKMAALCLLTCIPIVTIPAALSGFHAGVMRILQDVPGDPWFDFRHGWQSCWKKALPITLFFLTAGGLLQFALRYYAAQQGALAGLSLVCTGLLIVLAMAAVYVFPMLVAVELDTKAIVKNAFLLALARPHHAISGVAAGVALMTAAGFLSPVLLPVWAVLTLVTVAILADWFAWRDIQELIIR